MAYSELIKNFDKIRGYMREFFVYGFKSRDSYTMKSARSYDDERRRIESWLDSYMSFRQTPEGKNVFISVDSRSESFNPLNKAWKAKSFTDNDITLHFYIMDLLADGSELSFREIVDGIADYLQAFDNPLELDESTVRNKLREYVKLGLITSEKHGRDSVFCLSSDGVSLEEWKDAAAYFSEAAPLGVIGSYILDRFEDVPEYFNYKHHYILHTLDAQIMYGILSAMKEKKSIDLVNFNARRDSSAEHRVFPLKFYVSTQTGREYLLAYQYRTKRFSFFRLDTIRSVKEGPAEPDYLKYFERALPFEQKLWGVSTGPVNSPDHVEIVFRVEKYEPFIVERLEREKRHGKIEKLSDTEYRFTADICNSVELLPWARSFTGRIVSFKSSSDFVTERFYSDLDTMYAMYGTGGETE